MVHRLLKPAWLDNVYRGWVSIFSPTRCQPCEGLLISPASPFLQRFQNVFYGITVSISLTILTIQTIKSAPLVLVDGNYRPRSRIIHPLLYVTGVYAWNLGNEIVLLGVLVKTKAATSNPGRSILLTCARMILVAAEITLIFIKVSRPDRLTKYRIF